MVDERSKKALELEVIRIEEGLPLFDVRSQKIKSQKYRVLFDQIYSEKSCTCTDWKYQSKRYGPSFECKHIRAVKNFIAQELLGDEVAVVSKDEIKNEERKK